MTGLQDKSILITGGTGSFGSTMVKRALSVGAREVRIFSRDEAKQDEMRTKFADSRLNFYLGDVRDPLSVQQACAGMDFVFHAAALKQVPSCEFFPLQAVQTNVLGSSHVLNGAVAAKCAAVVVLSTDKAVQPINAMGMTKALMEKTMLAHARTTTAATRVCGVRYGNVLFSRGSVVPAFMKACLAGEPMRVTNPNMTRFLLPLSVAIDLVEAALDSAGMGDLLVRKAPAATIETIALAVAKALDVEPTITTIGDRHGEKLHETLATREELTRAVEGTDHFRLVMDDRDLNYALYTSAGQEAVQRHSDYTSENTERLGVDECTELLTAQPEYAKVIDNLRTGT